MTVTYNATIQPGATYGVTFTYTQADGVTPVPLAGYTARLQIRRTPSSAATLLDVTPAINTVTAVITVSLTAAQTALLPAAPGLGGAVAYALELTAAGGEPVIRLVEGVFTLDPEVVR